MRWIEYSFIFLVIFSSCIFSEDLKTNIIHTGSEFYSKSHLVYRNLKKNFYDELTEEYLLESSSSLEWKSLNDCQGMILCRVHVEGTEVVVLKVIEQESSNDVYKENTCSDSDEKESVKFLVTEDHDSGKTQKNLINSFINNSQECKECEECEECGECAGCQECEDGGLYISDSDLLLIDLIKSGKAKIVDNKDHVHSKTNNMNSFGYFCGSVDEQDLGPPNLS
ncbi:hypothetical protein T552_00475 [Pneumocystis carinii B80]|uniref:Uncharacterized protein n=1 Tax=Pneumocystis carinii (strain B80) TaxID=1408658 RepID=A0A0W4ZQW2_PNEC8|nr:hypothetical protein T552_00475 [Pneumocystis carinii B80]KTW30763.1 hypothetical protein T552_00475 [Pneumocystis carinii B80]